jgi:HlyD family secretion protein
MLKRLVILVVALAILGGGIGLMVKYQGANKKPVDAAAKIPDDYAKIGRGNLTIKVEGTGTVEPRTKVSLKSKASGRIEKLLVKEGDNVTKGQIVAVLDQTDQKLVVERAALSEKTARLRYESAKTSGLPQQLKTAEARVSELKLSLKNAQDRCDRIKQLFDKGYASQQEMDDAQKAVDSLKLQLDEATNTLRLLKSKDYERDIETARIGWQQADVELRQARKSLGDASITSPIDGTILAKFVEEGDTVVSSNQGFTEGTTLCAIADLRQVQVRGSIDEVDIGTVKIGQSAEMKVDAYPERTYDGKVVNVFPQGSTAPGGLTTFTVIVQVDNTDRSLLSNMTASIGIKTLELKNLLLVPFAAIRPGDKPEEVVVYIRNDKGIPEKRVVKLGVTDYEFYEVKDGLKEGDIVKIKNFPMNVQGGGGNVTVS